MSSGNVRIFSRANVALLLGLLTLLILCLVVWWSTRDAMSHLPFLKGVKQTRNVKTTVVDLRPWQTAEELASLAISAEEKELAAEAERLADHEVDQAFASALRQAQAAAQHKALTGNALRLSQKVLQFQRLVHDDQARVQALTPMPGAATTSDEFELAKAQLGLSSDELTDAQLDLARAVGDDRTRIQQELSAHEQAMKKHDAQAATQNQNAIAVSGRYGTLARRLTAWLDQRTRQELIDQAAMQADADALALTSKHTQAQNETDAGSADTETDAAERLKAVKNRSVNTQILSIFDDRIETEQQLAAIYRKWSAQVSLQHRILLHLLMQSIGLVVVILLGGLVTHALTRHFLERPNMDRRRLNTLRIISKLCIQIVTAALILLVVLGTPNQTPTILGLTTAGLTVVLQDFIISFCGWFVLMGKNGIRVGDWVEINGVAGEVVEVGLFRTAVLETGNWTDQGHPTGRRVTFLNSFAIKGQYFNFSTTGQWMWDELTVNVPASEDAYEVIERVQQAVLEETGNEAAMAEEEWKRMGRNNGLNKVSAAPAVDMRPGAAGIDILVRYVTRAASRFEVRNRLYARVIGLLHRRPAGV